MSGPFCETCRYIRRMPFDGRECADPTKIIEGPAGDNWNAAPPVHDRCSCPNHSAAETEGDAK
jgi:hypothetical protein